MKKLILTMKKLILILFAILVLSLFALVSKLFFDWVLSLNCGMHLFFRSIIAIAPLAFLYIFSSTILENYKLDSITGDSDADFARFRYEISPWYLFFTLLTIQGIYVLSASDIYSPSFLPIYMFTLIQTANDLYQKVKAFKKRNEHIYKPSTSRKLVIDSNYGEIQLSLINQDGSYKTSFEKDIVLSLNSNIGPISLVLSQQKNHSSKSTN